ncbi:MAG: hypothetical protein ABEJ95_01670 [Candidatus Nanohalobium sp.]
MSEANRREDVLKNLGGSEPQPRVFEAVDSLEKELSDSKADIGHIDLHLTYLEYEGDSDHIMLGYEAETTDMIKDELGLDESFSGNYVLSTENQDAQDLYSEWQEMFSDLDARTVTYDTYS